MNKRTENTWEPEENVRTEIIESSDDDETKNSQSSNKRKSVRKRKHLEKESKPIVNSTTGSSNKTPIILNHKISKKKKFDSNIESIHIENVNQSLD